ncbi:hypothetical protein CBR_g4737 [Chara braunii]|uniref:RNA helicase n=1 Tax=Chara braunii TaxID=69332 RepID=A0A388KIM9_CHABU|nr:hypothetical protein CBR_g4737 [Chara braunii]|eukprot:GBG69910.1 hypothetical protein CBR_g4737 [Chara braunii]
MAFGGITSPSRLAAVKLSLCHLSERSCCFRCRNVESGSPFFPGMRFFWPRSGGISTEARPALSGSRLIPAELTGHKERHAKSVSRRRLARLRSIVGGAEATTTTVKGAEPRVSSSSSSSSSPLDVLRLKVLEKQQEQQQSGSHSSALRDLSSSPSSLSSSSSSSVASKTASSIAGFKALGLRDELMGAISEMGLGSPTEIQALGIPPILAGEDVLIASHTGSGKTLAYLLPLIHKLRADEERTGKMARPRRPRAVVLGPTRELTEQVLHVAKSLSHHARFRSAMIGGGCRPKPQEDTLNSSLDLVIGTPGRLLMHVENGHLSYGDIKYVVLDEADTMFDRGFGPEVRKFLRPLRKRSAMAAAREGEEEREAAGSSFQCVLVTATLTKAVQRLIDEEFPGIQHVHTSTLHKRVAGSRHDFLPVSGDENKLEVLSQVLEPAVARNQRLMVFCNTLGSCRAAEHFLRETGIDTVCYHGEVPAEERVANLERFRGTSGTTGSSWERAAGVGGSSSVPVLVCTDLAARGLDLVVDHVVMFDFPRTPVDYLHRTGRTARMGAKGRITSLVTRRDQLLAREIEAAVKCGSSMENLTSDKNKLSAMKKREAEEQRKVKLRGKLKKGEKKGDRQFAGKKWPSKPPLGTAAAGRGKSPAAGKIAVESSRTRTSVQGRRGLPKNKPSAFIPKGTKGAARLALQRGHVVPGKLRAKDTTRRRRS